jgi:hypothetical protein
MESSQNFVFYVLHNKAAKNRQNEVLRSMFAISAEKADSFILLALHSMFAISVKKAYTIKKDYCFPAPSRATNQTLPGREKFNYSRPGRVWLVTSRVHGIHENPEQDLIS